MQRATTNIDLRRNAQLTGLLCRRIKKSSLLSEKLFLLFCSWLGYLNTCNPAYWSKTTSNKQRLRPTMNCGHVACVFIKNIKLVGALTLLLGCACKLLYLSEKPSSGRISLSKALYYP